MTTISISDLRESKETPVNLRSLQKLADSVSMYLHFPRGIIEINLIDSAVIHEVNREYRKIDEPTTVLSFVHLEWTEPTLLHSPVPPLENKGPPLLIGEILVSPAVILSRSKKNNESYLDNLELLIVHSLLHLIGYVHDSDDEAVIMEQREKEIMNLLHPFEEQEDK